MRPFPILASLVLACIAFPANLLAHAFIEHADPAVGSKVTRAPAQVRIWFTEALEAAFSTIKVLDAAGHEVQQGKTQIDKANAKILQASVPSLPAGNYKVVWRAVSVDTHVTHGDFTFTVAP